MYNIRCLAAAVLLLAAIVAGCSSDEDRRRAAQQASMEPTESVDEIYARRFAMEDFEHRLDNAQSFHSAGNGFLFRSTRDSLVADVNVFIRANPHIETDPGFGDFLGRLAMLDTLQHEHTVPYDGYSGVEDSLALSFADWPELDIELDPGVFSISNTVFPTIENKRIQFWIDYFTGPGRARFERAIYRMETYRPIVDAILDEKDLPRELAVIALIESGYSMRAVSYASAVGPWQFIYGTGKMYNLRVNWWYDERRDIVASTYAACHYLEDLHAIWGDWFLAFAAYNCGEYRVARQIARQRTENFWQLKLPRQTQRYVPKFLAALYILRDPGQWDITIPDVEPATFDEVTITDATDLELIARCAGTSVETIKQLNPQCRRWATPPRMEVVIRVPAGTGKTTVAELSKVPAEERITWRRHRVKKGETLSTIAGKYGTSVRALKDLNGIRNAHRIREGKYLLVPMAPGNATVASNTSKPRYKDDSRDINKKALEKYANRGAPPKGYKQVTYTVRPNDTLGEIAETYRTSASRIRSWNNLSYRRYIHPGQKLAIYVPETFNTPDQPVTGVDLPDENCCVKSTHVVRRGESFYSISKKYGVTLNELLAWNNKSARSTLRPGDRLDVWKDK